MRVTVYQHVRDASASAGGGKVAEESPGEVFPHGIPLQMLRTALEFPNTVISTHRHIHSRRERAKPYTTFFFFYDNKALMLSNVLNFVLAWNSILARPVEETFFALRSPS